MVRRTLIVQMTEGTTMIIPDEVWAVIGEDIQDLIENACIAIEEYHKEKARKDATKDN